MRPVWVVTVKLNAMQPINVGGLKSGWHQGKGSPKWEKLRTDVYAQAQCLVTEDGQSFTGHLWYKTEVELTSSKLQAKYICGSPAFSTNAGCM